MDEGFKLLTEIRQAVRRHYNKRSGVPIDQATEVLLATENAREAGLSEASIAAAISGQQFDHQC